MCQMCWLISDAWALRSEVHTCNPRPSAVPGWKLWNMHSTSPTRRRRGDQVARWQQCGATISDQRTSFQADEFIAKIHKWTPAKWINWHSRSYSGRWTSWLKLVEAMTTDKRCCCRREEWSKSKKEKKINQTFMQQLPQDKPGPVGPSQWLFTQQPLFHFKVWWRVFTFLSGLAYIGVIQALLWIERWFGEMGGGGGGTRSEVSVRVFEGVTGFSSAALRLLCVASRWPVLPPCVAATLCCQGLTSADRKTSRFLFRLHSLPPTSPWQTFREQRDYLSSLCAAGRLPPGQTLSGFRGECSRVRKVLCFAMRFMIFFFAGYTPPPPHPADWAKVIGLRCPGQIGEKFFRFFLGKTC